MSKTTPRTATVRRAHRRLAVLAVPALAVFALAACAEPVQPPAPPDVTVTPEVEPVRGEVPEPDVPTVWPLTGVLTDEVAERPALAVKVENTSAARPQSGIDQADVVWEQVVEFSVPRFIAVFHSQAPEVIGPIRSVRPMDAAIIAPLGGMFAASGGQGGILRMVTDSGTQMLNHGSADGFYRTSGRPAPHNVYAPADVLWQQANDSRTTPPPEQFAFALDADSATAVVDGDGASTLAVRLGGGRPVWTWDSGSGTWLRAEGSSPAVTADGARLSAVNVVVVHVRSFASGFRAQGGAAVPNLELDGTGDALVATGGSVVEATWTKDGIDGALLLEDGDGNPVLLAPGNTWVELVPIGGGGVDVS